jgi:hypothetical protein
MKINRILELAGLSEDQSEEISGWGTKETSSEDPMNALYVEYDSQRSGEETFIIHDQKFEYCNAIYPNGKKDIGVYAYAGDVCYGYNWFQEMLKKTNGKIF